MGNDLNRAKVIAKKIKENHWLFGAEIGVWKGDTFFYLLDRFPYLFMTGVDQWERYGGFGNKRTTGYIDYSKKGEELFSIFNRVKNKAKKYGTRVNILKMNSLSGAEYIKDKSLDFVFIDGDHRTSFVRADIAVWRPKVKKGGVIFGHDWNLSSVNRGLIGQKVQFVGNDHTWVIEL